MFDLLKENTVHELHQLISDVADELGLATWYDPSVNSEWADVRQGYFSEWSTEIGHPGVILLATRVTLDGHPTDALAVNAPPPLIILKRAAIARSRAALRALLVYEGSHHIVGAPARADVPSTILDDLLCRGPCWQARMEAALEFAEERREHWVALRLKRDVEQAALVWAGVVDDVEELAKFYPAMAQYL